MKGSIKLDVRIDFRQHDVMPEVRISSEYTAIDAKFLVIIKNTIQALAFSMSRDIEMSSIKAKTIGP